MLFRSGVVIGEELRSQHLSEAASVVLVGSDALTLRYRRAFEQRGVAVRSVGSHAAWRGLYDMAKRVS